MNGLHWAGGTQRFWHGTKTALPTAIRVFQFPRAGDLSLMSFDLFRIAYGTVV